MSHEQMEMFVITFRAFCSERPCRKYIGEGRNGVHYLQCGEDNVLALHEKSGLMDVLTDDLPPGVSDLIEAGEKAGYKIHYLK